MSREPFSDMDLHHARFGHSSRIGWLGVHVRKVLLFVPMPQIDWFDAPSQIREAIMGCVEGCRDSLESKFVGAYLHGSLTFGCYNPARSDVDMLIVSDCTVSKPRRERVLAEFQRGHSKLPGNGLEASLVATSSANGADTPPRFFTHFSKTGWAVADGDTGNVDFDLVLHFAAIRGRGIVLAGAPIKNVIMPIDFATYVEMLQSEFEWMTTPAQLEADPVYAILNASRFLVVSATRRVVVVSKLEGALAALPLVEARYQPLIEAALRTYGASDPDALDDIIVDGALLSDFMMLTKAAMTSLLTKTDHAF